MEFARAVRKLSSSGAAREKKIEQGELERWGVQNVTLRPYQLEGVSWLAERFELGHGCILGDEMGLGKTLQSISLLVYLHGSKGCRAPSLILSPLSVVNNWETELTRFSPALKVLNYSGGKEEREARKGEVLNHMTKPGLKGNFPFDVVLCHYDVIIRDSAFLQKFPWQCLIVDEAHRLKNPASVLYGLLTQFDVKFSLLLTGTPVQNNLNELYSLLSFVAPSTFPVARLERFVDRFSEVKDDKQKAASLHTVLQPFLLRRVKSEVLLDLPVKSEVILYTGLSATQKKYYKAILTKDLAAFGEAGSKTRLMNILIQLRKCVNHPYLFDGVEPEPFELGEHLVEASGKLFIIDRLLAHLKPRGHRVLMFSQMTRMLDIVQDYLGYRGYSYERLDGSVRGEERFLAIRKFSEDEETFIFLLSTKAGGQGLNLAGADTIIFVDSDFNPQNDLQAAARAHRIGQTRPVKVIRLLCRHTVEEIVLKRAHAKLELTQTVIEGGQFSHGTVGDTVPGTPTHLADVLKFGLDNLLQSSESSVVDEDLESILGRSEDGAWVMEEEGTKSEQKSKDKDGEAPETMYMYEGEDYSKLTDADKKSFDQLLADQLQISEGELGERVLRSEHRVPLAASLLPLERKRKVLTPEQLEERRRRREEARGRREEARVKRMRMMEEQERRKLEERTRRRMEFWQKHSYTSLTVSMETSSSEEEEEGVSTGDPSEREIRYVVGDVTHPQNAEDADAIVMHCVDDSGRWGKGGLFSALSARSLQPQTQYELAGRMKDLSLGDVHIVSIDDLMMRERGKDVLALIVAQTREAGGRLSGIKLSALSTGLQKVAKVARKRKASVHLPRIGHATPNFNWYGTERLIRKYLVSQGTPTYIYYFPRVNHPPRLSNNPPSSSSPLLPPGCEPLPDIFTDMVIGFHGVDAQKRRELSRYIVAYDGDISEDCLGVMTTHVLCGQDKSSLPTLPDGCQAELVRVEWLEECLRREKVVDTDTFRTDTSEATD